MGRNVTSDMVTHLVKRALIRKFEIFHLAQVDIISWIKVKWQPFISNILHMMTLVNGWVVFHFLFEADRQAIEQRYWVVGNGIWSWIIGNLNLILVNILCPNGISGLLFLTSLYFVGTLRAL